MNVQPNNFSLLIEGAPFLGDHANDDNLLQKGRPLIMRLRSSFLCKGNLDFSSNAQIAISPYSQPPSSSAMSFPTLQSGP
jgi:hypothetical protein